jgi:hypothetical protein
VTPGIVSKFWKGVVRDSLRFQHALLVLGAVCLVGWVLMSLGSNGIKKVAPRVARDFHRVGNILVTATIVICIYLLVRFAVDSALPLKP